MTKIWEWSITVLLIVGVVRASIHRFGVMGLVSSKAPRGKHCGTGHGPFLWRGQHRTSKARPDVWTIIQGAQKAHILPSMYYLVPVASQKGMARAA